MTILGNIHQHDKGRHVRALETARPLLARAGSGASLEQVQVTAGTLGVVSDVESHGSNPWTRYGIRWADGTWSNGLAYGEDFTFADGRPQTDTTRRTM